jgi:selenocysteine lyase/cysteine desulfurase
MYKKYYKEFLEANKGKTHLACHSHHYWPDVTRKAQLEYWDDSAKFVDDKWDYFFSTKIPATQKLISHILGIKDHNQIVFASNTHELISRLISSLDFSKEINILTTDSEFYSFDRQINRYSELQNVHVTKIETMPFDNFEKRFLEKANQNDYQLIFLSQVFFNSGMTLKNVSSFVKQIKNSNSLIVIDGYHGFMALPTDLSEIQDRIFYLAGAYKYAQGGEGCCFMYCPKVFRLRPLNTGWFAGLSSLGNMKNEVAYPDDALRFAGSTMDFTALYRLHSVLELFSKNDLSVDKIHQHIQQVQAKFREKIIELDHFYIAEKNILAIDYNHHGHFYTFALPSTDVAQKMYEELKRNNIYTDFRGSKLRFGFGLYHDGNFPLDFLKAHRKLT